MIRIREDGGPIPRREVFRRWVRRETPKEEYPDADPDAWDAARAIRELEASYDEPAEAADRGSPDWRSIRVDGAELGAFEAFPACGWDVLSGEGTIADAVDTLRGDSLAGEFPEARAKIATFRDLYPDREFGGLVARQYDDDWPPVLLEGNHRACAAHWAAREGVSVTVEVHLGHGRPFADLPLETER